MRTYLLGAYLLEHKSTYLLSESARNCWQRLPVIDRLLFFHILPNLEKELKSE